jgi:hypothetical protein
MGMPALYGDNGSHLEYEYSTVGISSRITQAANLVLYNGS